MQCVQLSQKCQLNLNNNASIPRRCRLWPNKVGGRRGKAVVVVPSEVRNDGMVTNIPASSGVRSDREAAILPLVSVAFLRWERGEEGEDLKRKDIFYFEPSWSTPTTVGTRCSQFNSLLPVWTYGRDNRRVFGECGVKRDLDEPYSLAGIEKYR